jgi:cytochrome c peroxidase
MCDGPEDPNLEPIDMHAPPGSAAFFAGNCRFITRKLWGAANEAPYFHHGQFTTLREAVLAHGGEAAATRARFQLLPPAERDAVIEFLESLQVLPPGTPFPVVDERGRPREWRSFF